MKTIYFSLLFAFFFALIKAGGDPYQATYYGGSNDNNTELNPSCLESKRPDTEYYAAISTQYGDSLCKNYAVVMAVDNKNSEYLGKMIKVKIVDSCRECEKSHIDLSATAFSYVRKQGDGVFPVMWVAGTTDGKVTRDVIYPSSKTESFAKSLGLSKSQFVSMFKKQALKMIVNGETHSTFNKSDVPSSTPTTTTKKTTTKVATATKTADTKPYSNKPTTSPSSNTPSSAPAVNENSNSIGLDAPVSSAVNPISNAVANNTDTNSVAGIGNITAVTGESNDKSVPENAPMVGDSEPIDPNQTDYSEEDLKKLESEFPDEEGKGGSYTVGALSAALTVTGAAGIGLLYLKKQSPGKYDELKQKFPEAFDNIKRSVSRSATSIKRGVTSIRGKGKNNGSRHGDHSGDNYREMPEHMFGKDGVTRYQLHDEPMYSFPDTIIKM